MGIKTAFLSIPLLRRLNCDGGKEGGGEEEKEERRGI